MTVYWTTFENNVLGFLNVFPLLKDVYMPIFFFFFENLLHMIIPLGQIICILSKVS